MAITFSKNIPTSVVSAYNNHNVAFSSDNAENSISCNILIGGLNYNITPDANNLFTYNFGGAKSIFVTECNSNDFIDSVLFDLDIATPNTMMVSDNSGYVELSAVFTITFDNATTETITKNYRVLRRVQSRRDTSTLAAELNLLQRNNNLNYYVGYPFDVSIYCSSGGSYDVKGYLDSDTTSVNITNGVNRFVISDGKDDLNWFFQTEGIKTISIDDELYININQQSNKCGVYIKYLNSFNGWSYHLFQDGNKEELKTKSLGLLYSDFDDDDNNPYLSIGKTSQRTITAHSKNVSQTDMDNLKDLFTSPKVYLYTGVTGLLMDANDFIAVDLKASSETIKSYKSTTYNVNVKINKPKDNTMSL